MSAVEINGQKLSVQDWQWELSEIANESTLLSRQMEKLLFDRNLLQKGVYYESELCQSELNWKKNCLHIFFGFPPPNFVWPAPHRKNEYYMTLKVLSCDPKLEMLSAVSTGNRIRRCGKCMRHCTCTHVKNDNIFRERQLNHYNIGVGSEGEQ